MLPVLAPSALLTPRAALILVISIAPWGSDRCYQIGYSMMVFNCHDCFGCYGLKKSEYCILNKQYTEEEYKRLLPKLVEHMKKTGEWGKWFPLSKSPFYYQDTAAWALYSKPT